MTIRGGGHPKQAMVLKPVSRMGPPPRSFAADAHDCIMVRSLWTYRIQGCGAMIRARWQAPSDRRPDRIKPAVVLEAVKVWPGKAGVRRKVGATANLDSSARAGFAILRVGAKKRDSTSNKETDRESKKERSLL
jgi:hypothetical protein